MRASLALVALLGGCSYERMSFELIEECIPERAPEIVLPPEVCGDSVTVTASFAPAAGVTYEAELGHEGSWFAAAVAGDQLAMTGVPSGSGYRWRLRAIAGSCTGPWRESATFAVLPGPPVPALASADVCEGAATLAVTWAPDGTSTYTVEVSKDGGAFTSASSSSPGLVEVPSPPPGAYFFRIAATSGACTTPFSTYGPFLVAAAAQLPSLIELPSTCEGPAPVLSFSDDWRGTGLTALLQKDGAAFTEVLVGGSPLALTAASEPGAYVLGLTAEATFPCTANAATELPFEVWPAPIAPALTPAADTCDGEAAFLQWSSAGFGDYLVEVDAGAGYSESGVAYGTNAGTASYTAPAGAYSWRVVHLTESCGNAVSEAGTFVSRHLPIVPTNLRADPLCLGDAALLAWDGSGEGTHQVFIANPNGVGGTQLDAAAGATSVPFAAPSLGNWPWYVVHTVEGCGSATSSAATLVVEGEPVTPVAASVEACAGAPATLAWSGGQAFGVYRVGTSYLATDFQDLGDVAAGQSSVALPTSDPASAEWRVRHETACGNSDHSVAALSVRAEPASLPTALTAPPSCTSTSSAVSFSGAAFGAYEVEVSLDGTTYSTAPVLDVSGSGALFAAAPAGVHPWRVRHRTICGVSDFATSSYTVHEPPDVPTNLGPSSGSVGRSVALSYSCSPRGTVTVDIDYADGRGRVQDGISNVTYSSARLTSMLAGSFTWYVTHRVDGCPQIAEAAAPITLMPAAIVPGSLDASFGSGGLVEQLVGGEVAYGSGVAVLGEVIYVGGTMGQYPSDFFLARFDGSGTLLGHTPADLGVTVETHEASAALVADAEQGLLYLAGSTDQETTYTDFGATRFDAAGARSPAPWQRFTYEAIGSPYHGDDYAADAVLSGNGLFMVGGASDHATTDGALLIKIDRATGALDGAFGSVYLDYGGSEHFAAVAADAAGRIVVAGYGNFGRFVARFSGTSGVQDTSFNFRPISVDPHALVIDSLGRFYVLGATNTPEIAVQRLTADGTNDTTFGASGLVVFSGMTGYAEAGLLLGDELVIAGGALGDFFAARLSVDGAKLWTLPIDFGTTGDGAVALAADGLGRLVLVGQSNDGNGSSLLALARVHP